MARSGILFDVDGTLVDSNYHHTIAWSRALRDHGHDVPLAAIHRRIGMGGSELLDALIGRGDDRIEDAWRGHFDVLVPEVRSFDGASDLLHAVHSGGHAVVLATSSPEDLLARWRATIGADDAIDAVVSSGDVDRAKPHPDIFEVALKKASVSRRRAVVVGDSVWDMKAAARAGLPCVAVECGGYCRAELERAGAIAVYRDPRELLDNLDALPVLGESG